MIEDNKPKLSAGAERIARYLMKTTQESDGRLGVGHYVARQLNDGRAIRVEYIDPDQDGPFLAVDVRTAKPDQVGFEVKERAKNRYKECVINFMDRSVFVDMIGDWRRNFHSYEDRYESVLNYLLRLLNEGDAAKKETPQGVAQGSC